MMIFFLIPNKKKESKETSSMDAKILGQQVNRILYNGANQAHYQWNKQMREEHTWHHLLIVLTYKSKSQSKLGH